MWWVFAALSKWLGYRLSEATEAAIAAVGSIESEDRLLAVAAGRSRIPWEEIRGHPSGLFDASAPAAGWLVPDRLPAGRLDLCPPELADQLGSWWRAPDPEGLLLLSRRLPRQMNSSLRDVDSQRRPGPLPTLLMCAADADRLELADGDAVVVSTATGSTDAVLEVTSTMLPGTATLPHGWAVPRVNALISNDQLDELTGMPRLSGLPIQVRKSTRAG